MMDDKEIDGLPSLTPKQAKFVEGIKKGLSKSEAYRQAYDASRMKPETIWAKASTLASSDKVREWTKEIDRQTFKELSTVDKYSKENYIQELTSIIDLAIADKKYAPALQGMSQKGKALGHLTDNLNVNQKVTAQDRDMFDRLEALLGKDARQQMERSLGFTPTESVSKEKMN